MKRYLMIGFAILLSLILTSCAHNRLPALHADLAQESWMREMNTNPYQWTRGADRWFLTGDPNVIEEMNRHAPDSAAISTMMVRVPDFRDIEVNGDFEVQIFGTYEHNSVYLYGPNTGVREVVVEVRGNKLCIYQAKDARRRQMGHVIVRVGVTDLAHLIQRGRGTIEGIQLRSHCLYITATPSAEGKIYLSGNMNVRHITQGGRGSINVMGANTPLLDISTDGSGAVNVSGHVGIRSLLHRGSSDINIIGANSAGLKIDADGRGRIALTGGRDARLNVREVRAKGNTCVYAYYVNSDYLYACAYNNARVGLAGCTNDLSVDTSGSSRFYGHYLCAQNAYVRARDDSHINVTASNKIFAAATQNSSVYLFGLPEYMSQFISGNGIIIPIWGEGMQICPIGSRVHINHRIKRAAELPA